jgi:hypothetical protein
VAATIAAMTAATASSKIMRLNALPVTISCCLNTGLLS